MIGGQTKTPTMSVLYEGRDDYIGGAAVVAEHLRAAGAEVTFSTVLGNDALKDFVLKGLEKSGVDCRAGDRRDPPDHPQERDRGGRLPAAQGGHARQPLDLRRYPRPTSCEAVANTPCDAVVFSDFRHGIFNRRTIPRLIAAIPDGVYKVADSQVASRWGNITDFKGFDLITPNEREARFALGDQDSGIRPLASALYDAAQCKTLILKLGENGRVGLSRRQP